MMSYWTLKANHIFQQKALIQLIRGIFSSIPIAVLPLFCHVSTIFGFSRFLSKYRCILLCGPSAVLKLRTNGIGGQVMHGKTTSVFVQPQASGINDIVPTSQTDWLYSPYIYICMLCQGFGSGSVCFNRPVRFSLVGARPTGQGPSPPIISWVARLPLNWPLHWWCSCVCGRACHRGPIWFPFFPCVGCLNCAPRIGEFWWMLFTLWFLLVLQHSSYSASSIQEAACQGTPGLVPPSEGLDTLAEEQVESATPSPPKSPLEGSLVSQSSWSIFPYGGEQRPLEVWRMQEDCKGIFKFLCLLWQALVPGLGPQFCASLWQSGTASGLLVIAAGWLAWLGAKTQITKENRKSKETWQRKRKGEGGEQKRHRSWAVSTFYTSSFSLPTPPALPPTIQAATSQPSVASSPFQVAKKQLQTKEEQELQSLRNLAKTLKSQSGLAEEVVKALNASEEAMQKEHTKSYRDLITALGSARKSLTDLDQEWADYRSQWAAYMDSVSKMWIEQAESFEKGEDVFAHKRKDVIEKIHGLRAKLHDIHRKTMKTEQEPGSEDADDAVEMAEAELMEEKEDTAEHAHLQTMKTQMSTAVKVLKESIEARVRPRSRSARRGGGTDEEDCQILEPKPKDAKKTPGGV